MRELDQLKILSESITRIASLNEGTYWNDDGQYQKQAKELEELVPDSGPAKTLRGEIFRAATKVYHDYFNNGFGNEWPAPAQFLMNHLKLSDDVTRMLLGHAMGIVYTGEYANEIEELISTTIKQIYKMKDQPNTTDMWATDYSEADFVPYEDEEDPWDDDEEEEEGYY